MIFEKILLAVLAFLCFNSTDSCMVTRQKKRLKGEFMCDLDSTIPSSNTTHVNVYIHPKNFADGSASLFGKIKNFKKFPVRFQVTYSKEELVNNEFMYDEMYAVFKDAKGGYKGTSFNCHTNGIDKKLLSLISNNLEKVSIKFYKSK
jgi:hypothetical protein